MASNPASIKNTSETRQIGRVVISLPTAKISKEERELLAHPNIGGVVIYRVNYETSHPEPREALAQFIAEIRSINPNIIFMIDHEGGRVWRLERGFTKLPAAKTLGDAYTVNAKSALDLAFERGHIMASELMSLGIISLAPVVDSHGTCSVIGGYERAFHADPKINSELAEAFARGMAYVGMPVTLKHFPDHGAATSDSHVASSTDHRTEAELEHAMIPYRDLIQKNLVSAVMPAHVTYPAVDEQNTAGYSREWLNNRLRTRLQFQGVIISDCLNMTGAGTTTKTAFERLEAAEQAGCDFLMITLHQIKDAAEHRRIIQELKAGLDRISDNPASQARRKAFQDRIEAGKLRFSSLTNTVQTTIQAMTAIDVVDAVTKPTNIVLTYLYSNSVTTSGIPTSVGEDRRVLPAPVNTSTACNSRSLQ